MAVGVGVEGRPAPPHPSRIARGLSHGKSEEGPRFSLWPLSHGLALLVCLPSVAAWALVCLGSQAGHPLPAAPPTPPHPVRVRTVTRAAKNTQGIKVINNPGEINYRPGIGQKPGPARPSGGPTLLGLLLIAPLRSPNASFAKLTAPSTLSLSVPRAGGALRPSRPTSPPWHLARRRRNTPFPVATAAEPEKPRF